MFSELESKDQKICVVGLGYVGLPLAIILAKKFSVVGFDINKNKINNLKKGIDATEEVDTKLLEKSVVEFSSDSSSIKDAKFIIITIPTPIDDNKKPDLKLMKEASELVGNNLSKGAVVVYESTVYPGVTEEICVPILEKESGLKAGADFKIGYSPERVNPGDKEHTIDKIIKVVSGMDEESLELIDKVYSSVISAGTFRATSIKVAEAAKVIENTQRDLNIALVNELAIIFQRLDISTHEVIEAATTKWNFIKFTPGLVGGHCIGVDPYYLTYKAESLGYRPEVILAGRRINDSMGRFIAQQVVKKMAQMNRAIKSSKVAILGITFKENVSDIRNSKLADIYNELVEFGIKPLVYDNLADKKEVKKEYNIELCEWEDIKNIDTLIIAVPHEKFKKMLINDYKKLMNSDKLLLVDIKHILNKQEVEKLGIKYWSL